MRYLLIVLAGLVSCNKDAMEVERRLNDVTWFATTSNTAYDELNARTQEIVKEKEIIAESLQEATNKYKELEGFFNEKDKELKKLKEQQGYIYKHIGFGVYIRKKVV